MYNPLNGDVIIERKNLNWLWLIAVFLFSVNLFSKLNHVLLGVFIIGVVISFYKKATFRFTLDLLILLLFSISYFFLYIQYNIYNIGVILQLLVGPGALFLVGYIIVNKQRKIIINTVLVIVFGTFTYGLLNMINYLNVYGTDSLFRLVPDIWTGEYLSSTLQGTNFTLASCLLFYCMLLLSNWEKKLLALLLILSVAISVWSSLVMGNRTVPLIIIIVFAANVFLYISLTTGDIKKILKIFSFTIISFSLLWWLYVINSFGIKEYILHSNLYLRMEQMSLKEDPRGIIYLTVFKQMFQYPLGGYRMALGGLSYAHNLWLDVLYATGLIPFFFLTLYTVKSMYNIIRITINKNLDNHFKILLVSIFLAFLLNFMVEPILEGVPRIFLLFCLFSGMVRKYFDISRKNCLYSSRLKPQ